MCVSVCTVRDGKLKEENNGELYLSCQWLFIAQLNVPLFAKMF